MGRPYPCPCSSHPLALRAGRGIREHAGVKELQRGRHLEWQHGGKTAKEGRGGGGGWGGRCPVLAISHSVTAAWLYGAPPVTLLPLIDIKMH